MVALRLSEQIRLLLWGVAVIAALLVLLGASAILLRNARAYNRAVESGRLSDANQVGYFTRDAGTVALLKEIDFSGLGEQVDPDNPVYTVLGKDGRTKGELPAPPDPSPAKIILRSDPRLAETLRGVPVDSIWEIAPVVLFADDERLISTSVAQFARANPSAFTIASRPRKVENASSEDIEALDDRSGAAKSALLSYLWYTRKLVVPKVKRLVNSGRIFAAQRLVRGTASILSSFVISNQHLDQGTLRRVSAVYLMEVLFERPAEILRSTANTAGALEAIQAMMDPEAEQSFLSGGPPTYRSIVQLASDVSWGAYDQLEMSGLQPATLTSKERDLVSLLLVRAAFWKAWRVCVKVRVAADCRAATADFRTEAALSGRPITKANFQRDVEYYKAEAAKW